MNAVEKIKRSWWVIFSLIFFFNGFGFVYIGAIHDNKNWILEGIIYEIPWVFGIIFGYSNSLVRMYVAVSLILMLVSIVRSIWVAIKLGDVYDNEEKYAIQSTVLSNSNVQENSDFPISVAFFSCLILLLIAFISVALL